MATTTLRAHHLVSKNYSDLIASIPDAAGKTGFVKHLGGAEVEIVLGGEDPPAATVRGSILPPRGEEWAQAAAIWLRCPHGGEATVGFIEFSEDAG